MSILQLSWRRRRKTKPAHHLVAKRFSHPRLCDFARCAFGPDWRGRWHLATAIERALHRSSFTFSIGCSDSPDTERASRRRRVVRKLSRRAQPWLRGHTRTDWTYTMRVSAGMHDLRNLYVRANAFVACHQNVESDLLKGGHPALVFELDSQSVNELKIGRTKILGAVYEHGWLA